MYTSQHAIERMAARLSVGEAERTMTVARTILSVRPDTNAAILVFRTPVKRVCRDGSNGHNLWAVIRDSTLVTVEWRRDSQRVTRDAFRVRDLFVLNGTQVTKVG